MLCHVITRYFDVITITNSSCYNNKSFMLLRYNVKCYRCVITIDNINGHRIRDVTITQS